MNPFLRRFLAWNARITQSDFLIYVLLFAAGVFWLASGTSIRAEGQGAGWTRNFIWPLLGFLFYGASKRCRDMGLHPLLGFLFVVMPFGVLILLVNKGTSGANPYGPDPRVRAAAPAATP